jgi:nucleotide-binding universal stress UspA family protein
MLRYIVAPAAGRTGEEIVLRTALAVARAFEAHVEFVHVRVDIAKVAMKAGVSGLVEPQSEIDAMDAGESQAQRAALEAVSRLAAAASVPFGGGAGASAAFTVETGEEADWITEYGRFADLIVGGRVDDGVSVTVDVAEAALLDSGAPILISPAHDSPVIGGHVVVAWTDSRAALRAVHSAMPFIERASKVTVVCLNAGPAEKEVAERLLRALRWHNREAGLRLESIDEAFLVTTLFDIAARLEATMLVMGGYSHSPLREAIFGGTTKAVLTQAPLPVLLAH